MVLTAFLLVTVAVALCAFGIRYAFRRLGLGFMSTLLYLGLAEVPPPNVSRRAAERRRRAAASPHSASLRAAS